MKRNVSMEEISDGKLYRSNEMVQADCKGCDGCWKCCSGMGNSIVLDPYDVFLLVTGLSVSTETLFSNNLELHVVDGIILPNLKMKKDSDCCVFLDSNHRCSIHSFRPGLCRLFPLGRYYEKNTFSYFLQTKECAKTDRDYIKVKNWLGIQNLREYESYICTWHNFLKEVSDNYFKNHDDDYLRQMNLLILKVFFMTPYDTNKTFFAQFYERLEQINSLIASIKARPYF